MTLDSVVTPAPDYYELLGVTRSAQLREPFPWLRPIITVALHEALRLGEALGLQWEDVDFTARSGSGRAPSSS